MGQGDKKLTQVLFVFPQFWVSLQFLKSALPDANLSDHIGYEMVQYWEILNHELQTGCEK